LQIAFRRFQRYRLLVPDDQIVDKIEYWTQSNWCVEQHKKPDNADWNAHRF